ncbi:unnamed protein product [Linum tenue]|uniref:Uncharacterized protein n=1 Tax=Linum tenue TaxID=586396 RepID=A0AAV0RRQ6_9ROSI|nr:unnamed protein product [Linum tenue]
MVESFAYWDVGWLRSDPSAWAYLLDVW